ncbi:hypothetical protein HOY80DRAFT_448651 [Tuber brumale]|nr:hypothetical protein HOY80DRAFT_448651 [Tuber brumale]
MLGIIYSSQNCCGGRLSTGMINSAGIIGRSCPVISLAIFSIRLPYRNSQSRPINLPIFFIFHFSFPLPFGLPGRRLMGRFVRKQRQLAPGMVTGGRCL